MLDNFRETAITWDKANRKVYESLRVSAGDNKGRKLSVQVVNGGVIESLSGASLSLFWETKDKAHKGLDAFTAVDATKGEFEIYYTTGMLSNEGTLNANLVLVDTSGRVVSEPFTITVFKGIDDDAIQSSDSFTALTEALAQVGTINNKADRAELLALESTFEQNKVSVDQQLQQTQEETSELFRTKVDNVAIEAVNARVDNIVAGGGDGTKDTELLDTRVDLLGVTYDSAKKRLDTNQANVLLEAESISGTTQSLTLTSGQVTRIQHRNRDNTIIREDVFTYSKNVIVEHRTLFTGDQVVYHYRLTDFSAQVLSKYRKLYENKLKYNPATWEEWQSKGAAVVEGGYLKVENLATDIYPFLPTAIKPNTKYGILLNVRENTRTTSSVIVSGSGGAYPFPNAVSIAPGVTGAFKSVQTTNNFTTSADFRSGLTKNAGKIVYGDLRVIELPVGSKIEQDFTNLSADLLNKMYPQGVL